MNQFKYSEWWEENRAAVNERRRWRWRNDPEYRERAKKWGKQKSGIEKRERNAAAVVRRKFTRNPEEVEFGGRRVLAYGISVLARYVGRKKQTINSWERKGFLPRTPLMSKRGERLYTPGMMKAIKDVVRKMEKEGLTKGRRRVDGDKMYRLILRRWKKIEESGEGNVRIDFSNLIEVPDIVEKSVVVDGEEKKAFTTEMLARVCRRSRYQVQVWEQKGFLPKTPFLTTRRWRLYTREMMEVVREAMESRSAPDESMYDEIVEGWRELGIELRK